MNDAQPPSPSTNPNAPRSLGSIFGLTLLGSVLVFLSYFYVTNHILHHPFHQFKIFDQTYVTEQIDVSDFRFIQRGGVKTIIDVRPDGEDPKQTPSEQIRREAESHDMRFAYIPVAHGPIPDQAVTDLESALMNNPKPVLMYCRTGNRAARTFALVLASQPDGPDLKSILDMVKATEHSADDLSEEIQARINKRPKQK